MRDEEQARHTEVLRAGAPVTVGRLSLLPIERVVLHSHWGDARAWVSASKEPYALVVRDAAGLRVVDTAAAASVSLEVLRERVAGLDAALAGM
ncbi:MAG: hypothetical protein HZC37_18855 [Burkholderiales bacterium]|nr:hypothetical protein [Burkholderiales bacterium]